MVNISFLFFQLNDVALGGGTAFPFLKLVVPPVKGSLLIWYNLHRSTYKDYRTRHAGCPVLKGSKWSKLSLNFTKIKCCLNQNYFLQYVLSSSMWVVRNSGDPVDSTAMWESSTT